MNAAPEKSAAGRAKAAASPPNPHELPDLTTGYPLPPPLPPPLPAPLPAPLPPPLPALLPPPLPAPLLQTPRLKGLPSGVMVREEKNEDNARAEIKYHRRGLMAPPHLFLTVNMPLFNYP